MEKKKKKVHTVGIVYLSLVGDLSDLQKVVQYSFLYFKKENLLILGIKSLLHYQGLIFSGNKGFGNWEIH